MPPRARCARSLRAARRASTSMNANDDARRNAETRRRSQETSIGVCPRARRVQRSPLRGSGEVAVARRDRSASAGPVGARRRASGGQPHGERRSDERAQRAIEAPLRPQTRGVVARPARSCTPVQPCSSARERRRRPPARRRGPRSAVRRRSSDRRSRRHRRRAAARRASARVATRSTASGPRTVGGGDETARVQIDRAACGRPRARLISVAERIVRARDRRRRDGLTRQTLVRPSGSGATPM